MTSATLPRGVRRSGIGGEESRTPGFAARLRGKIGTERYRKWFGDAVQIRQEGSSVEVVVGSAFLADMLERRYGETIRETAREGAAPGGSAVAIRVDPGAFRCEEQSGADEPRPGVPRVPAAGDRQPQPRRPAGGLGDTPPTLSPPGPGPSPNGPARRLLEDFVVGACNALAYECAVRLADGESPSPFGLLFLHGACGVGKTHLLAGVAARHAAARPGARVRCVSAETFTNEYIQALRSHSIDRFRKRHRELDLLCIDDIHFLSTKEATQGEFLHTFDALELQGTRICLASDEHPGRIRSFSKELVSRFLSGMVVGVERPDRETGSRIAQRLAATRGMTIDERTAAMLAGRCAGSVRDIEGAVVRLDALRRLPGMSDGRVTPALVEHALGRSGPERPRRPMRVDRIVEHVAESLGVDVSELLGRGRHRRVVLARSMVAYLSRRLTTLSFPEIARAMNRPNHSSVITACQRVEAQIRAGEECAAGPGLDRVTVAELADRLEREMVRLGEAA